MRAILRFIAGCYGQFNQYRPALVRADYCLWMCQGAFIRKMRAENCSPEWQEAWAKEQFWSRNHNRFWNIAWRRPAFKK